MSYDLVALGDIFRITSGGTPSRRIAEYYEDGKIHWIKTGDLHNKYIESASEFITQEALNSSSTKLYPKGTVLIAMYGATIGACSILNIEACTNQACAAFTPNEGVNNEYLYYWFKFNKNNFVRAGAGGAQPNISATFLKQYKIPLPPLPVQKQIAAVLEKADTLRNQCQQMEQELNSLAQSVFLDMFGDPVANPKGFELVPLGGLSEVQIGPFGTMLHKSDYVSGGIPLINPTHIAKSLIVPSDDLTITISKYNELPQYHLKEGDIIMGRRGEMGRCAIVSGSAVGYFCGTGSLFIRPNQKRLKPQYLNDLLSSLPMKRWFEEQSLGATMANLNKGIVSAVMVPLPSIDFQVRYEEVLKNISERLQNNSILKNEIEVNFNSLMQRAFKGELNLKDVA